LQLEVPTTTSTEYFRSPKEQKDLRSFIVCKKEPDYPLPEYRQLFGDKHGYLKNLSILDLLFNEGTNALTYLEQVDLSAL